MGEHNGETAADEHLRRLAALRGEAQLPSIFSEGQKISHLKTQMDTSAMPKSLTRIDDGFWISVTRNLPESRGGG
jgi:hypothetical protein